MNNHRRATILPGFLPDFCNIRVILAVIIAAELLALVLSIASWQSFNDFLGRLGMLSLYIQWIALGTTSLLCLACRFMRNSGTLLSALLTLLLLALVTVAAAAVVCQQPLLHEQCPAFVWQSLAVSLIIGILGMHYLYLQKRLTQQQQAEADARLDALQARIRPHFLFNSMNTIAYLTREDPQRAEQVTEDLSELFRQALADPGKMSTLQREIRLTRGYLNIEQLRLGDRLQVSWEIDSTIEAQLGDVLIPPLTLQPLVENAVYHGIEPSQVTGRIAIVIERIASGVQITIENPITQHSGHHAGNQIARENIRERLQAVFERAATFEFEQTAHRYRVQIRLPIWHSREQA